MGLTNFKQRRPYLVTAPVMANMYLLIKVHGKFSRKGGGESNRQPNLPDMQRTNENIKSA